MVPLSWFMKKNWNLNLGKKSSFCIENGTFCLKLSVIKLKSSIFSTKWTFFPQIQISIFLHKSTQWDHRRLLHKFQEETFFFTCVWICLYMPTTVKNSFFPDFDNTIPVPLLFDVHWYAGSAPKQVNYSPWREVALRENLVIVWPNGMNDTSSGSGYVIVF